MTSVAGYRVAIVSSPVLQNDRLAMLQEARLLDVDVLLYGDDCKLNIFEENGCLFVNPGSATGAKGSVPSFALLDIQGEEIVCYSYQLVGDQVKVEKSDFRKSANK